MKYKVCGGGSGNLDCYTSMPSERPSLSFTPTVSVKPSETPTISSVPTVPPCVDVPGWYDSYYRDCDAYNATFDDDYYYEDDYYYYENDYSRFHDDFYYGDDDASICDKFGDGYAGIYGLTANEACCGEF